jgi:hypothetical protein
VSDLRRLFANPHVLDVLLVDGPAFVGVVDRADLAGLPDGTPAEVGIALEGLLRLNTTTTGFRR